MAEVSKEVEKKCGLNVSEQSVLFHGKLLSPDDKLEDIRSFVTRGGEVDEFITSRSIYFSTALNHVSCKSSDPPPAATALRND